MGAGELKQQAIRSKILLLEIQKNKLIRQRNEKENKLKEVEYIGDVISQPITEQPKPRPTLRSKKPLKQLKQVRSMKASQLKNKIQLWPIKEMPLRRKRKKAKIVVNRKIVDRVIVESFYNKKGKDFDNILAIIDEVIESNKKDNSSKLFMYNCNYSTSNELNCYY